MRIAIILIQEVPLTTSLNSWQIAFNFSALFTQGCSLSTTPELIALTRQRVLADIILSSAT